MAEQLPEVLLEKAVEAPSSVATDGGSDKVAFKHREGDGDDDLAGLKQEEETARRALLAQRKANLQQRQQAAARSSAEAPGGSHVVSPPPSGVGLTQSTQAATATKPDPTVPGQKKQQEQVVRADAVENAVRFLNHPKVKASPLGKRLAFLEHKGLNDAEIALALKRANISSEEVKTAMELADSSSSSSSASSSSPASSSSLSASVGGGAPPGGGGGGGPAPPLPPRAGGGLQHASPLPPPAPEGWGWGARAVGALAFFSLGSAASFLAARYLLPGGKATSSSSSSSRPPAGVHETPAEPGKHGGRGADERKEEATDRLQAELEAVRASQEVLATQMRDAFVAMKEAIDSQKARQSRPPPGATGLLQEAEEEVPSVKSPVASSTAAVTPDDKETIAALKTELKTLRAMVLDARTAESVATRASTVADLPSLAIPPSSSALGIGEPVVAQPSPGLPSWQLSSKRSFLSSRDPSSSSSSSSPAAAPAAVPVTSPLTGGKPSAPKPYERRAAATTTSSSSSSLGGGSTTAFSHNDRQHQQKEEEEDHHQEQAVVEPEGAAAVDTTEAKSKSSSSKAATQEEGASPQAPSSHLRHDGDAREV